MLGSGLLCLCPFQLPCLSPSLGGIVIVLQMGGAGSAGYVSAAAGKASVAYLRCERYIFLERQDVFLRLCLRLLP